MKNGLCKIVTKSQVVTKFNVTKSKLHCTAPLNLFPIDLDEGENAEIEYAIIDGNDNRIFAISRGEQNQGLLTVERRLDREEAGVYLLTIKCFRPYEKKLKSQVSKYNSVVSFFPRFFFSFFCEI